MEETSKGRSYARPRYVVTAVAALLLALGLTGAAVADHGTNVGKGCNSPTLVGQLVKCSYSLQNTDTFGDSLTFDSVVDILQTAGGPVNSGNIIGSLSFNFVTNGGATPPSCNGAPGGTPFVGATDCTLFPDQTAGGANGNGVNTVAGPGFYTAAGADFDNPNHRISDVVTFGVTDNCESQAPDCNPAETSVSRGASTLVQQYSPSISTALQSSTIAAGQSVTDTATIAVTPASPPPTKFGGTVSYSYFPSVADCQAGTNGTAAGGGTVADDGTVPNSDPVTFNTPGQFFFQAKYTGSYDNGIAAHGITGTGTGVTTNGSTAFSDPTANFTQDYVGAHIQINTTAGPGNVPPAASKTYIIASVTDSTHVVLATAFTGASKTNANWDTSGLPVYSDCASEPLSVEDITIAIAPDDTNEVGVDHTFTATVYRNAGDGSGYVPQANAPVTVTLTDSNGSAAVATTPLTGTTDGSGHFSVTFHSDSAGQVIGSASTTQTIGGQSVTRTTGDGYDAPGNNPHDSDSGNATKTYVDAYITISPPFATNPLSATHTFTATVWVNDGLGGGFVHAPDGTSVTFSYVGSHVGSITSTNPCTTTNGSCSVDTTSSSAGHDTMQASTTLDVGGTTPGGPVSLTRTTGTASVGHANGDNAGKLWIATKVINESGGGDITGQTVTGPVTVHDLFSAGSNAGGTAPDGSVTFEFFNNNTCTGAPAATEGPIALNASGQAVSSTQTVSAAGGYCYLALYSGDSNYPNGTADKEPFNLTTPTGQITPTNVSCQQFNAGTASLPGINYTTTGTGANAKIAQSINPGVFFFWTHVTTTTANQVVTVTQSNTSTNNSALFLVHQTWQRLYTGDCTSYVTGTQTGGGSGASFTVPKPGDYIIGIQYQTKSIAGTKAPQPANITFNWVTSLGGNTGASVPLNKTP
jgi:hypothetical protein